VLYVLGLAAVLLLPVAPQWVLAQEQDDGEPEVVLDDEVRTESLDNVPPIVMAAARAAGPDVVLQSVYSLWIDDRRVYRFRGRLYREVWRIDVTDTGRVLRVKRDNQDD
jgi:hypothetical protein